MKSGTINTVFIRLEIAYHRYMAWIDFEYVAAMAYC